MAINLTGQKIKDTFQEVLHVDGGVDGTDKPIYDGDGTELPIKVSTTSIDITSLKLATVPIVATGAEVNHLTGARSNIQTQLDYFAAYEFMTGVFTWDAATATPDAVAGRKHLVQNLHNQMRGCVLKVDGSVNYYLSADDWALKADGSPSDLTGADGNVMVQIPKFYYRFEQAGKRYTWKISAAKQVGFKLHPAFFKDGAEVDFRYYGAYDASYLDATDATYKSGLNLDDMTANLDLAADKLASVKGAYPLVGVTRAECRTLASNVGTGWRQLDFDLWSAVQMLYLIEYQSFYSQDILGAGNTNGSYVASSSSQSDSPHTIAGAGDSIANGSTDTTSGAGVSAKPGTSFMKYRGIENLYGNCWTFTDGININVGGTGNVHMTNNAANWADNTATNYDLITDSLTTGSNFISNLLPADPYFLASEVSGSSSTYITDRHYGSASSNRVVLVGGFAINGANAGAFCLSAVFDSSDAYRTVGGRLCF